MFGAKRKTKSWLVMCKACGRPFPTGHDHEAAGDLPPSADYQCTYCGLSDTYARADHRPAA